MQDSYIAVQFAKSAYNKSKTFISLDTGTKM